LDEIKKAMELFGIYCQLLLYENVQTNLSIKEICEDLFYEWIALLRKKYFSNDGIKKMQKLKPVQILFLAISFIITRSLTKVRDDTA
jgi:hypothetical protein